MPDDTAVSPRRAMEHGLRHDQLADGRRIRVFAVIDDFTRQSVGVTVGTSLTGSHVTAALDEAIGAYGCPRRLVCDNGTEFTSLVFQQWAARRGIDVQFIEPGKPNQNAFAESFNARFRDECLNTHWFRNLADARRRIAGWRDHYNRSRPHSAHGSLTPDQFKRSWTTNQNSDEPAVSSLKWS